MSAIGQADIKKAVRRLSRVEPTSAILKRRLRISLRVSVRRSHGSPPSPSLEYLPGVSGREERDVLDDAGAGSQAHKFLVINALHDRYGVVGLARNLSYGVIVGYLLVRSDQCGPIHKADVKCGRSSLDRGAAKFVSQGTHAPNMGIHPGPCLRILGLKPGNQVLFAPPPGRRCVRIGPVSDRRLTHEKHTYLSTKNANSQDLCG